MARQRFEVELICSAVIELDDAVIAAVDDDWRRTFYGDIDSPQEIARHIAYNLVANGGRLSQLDGWADQPDENAVLVSADWTTECL